VCLASNWQISEHHRSEFPTIQLPQLRDNNNSSEFNTTYENLLCGYLFLDGGALSTSLVAALILLWSNFNYPKFQIPAVEFSISMVCSAIIMMFGAFFSSVRIALPGSHGGLLTIIVEVVAVMFFLAQAFLVFPWIIPLYFNEVLLRVLLHYFYYNLFLVFIYSAGGCLINSLISRESTIFSKVRGRDIGIDNILDCVCLPIVHGNNLNL